MSFLGWWTQENSRTVRWAQKFRRRRQATERARDAVENLSNEVETAARHTEQGDADGAQSALDRAQQATSRFRHRLRLPTLWSGDGAKDLEDDDAWDDDSNDEGGDLTITVTTTATAMPITSTTTTTVHVIATPPVLKVLDGPIKFHYHYPKHQRVWHCRTVKSAMFRPAARRQTLQDISYIPNVDHVDQSVSAEFQCVDDILDLHCELCPPGCPCNLARPPICGEWDEGMQWVTDQVGNHSETSGSLNYWLAIDFAGDVGAVGGVAER
jgi:hypothetical protein